MTCLLSFYCSCPDILSFARESNFVNLIFSFGADTETATANSFSMFLYCLRILTLFLLSLLSERVVYKLLDHKYVC